MHHLIKWLTPVIAFGVAVFIVFFLLKINASNKVSDDIKKLIVKHQDVGIKKPMTPWLKSFEVTEKKGYFYPVNEVYMHINLSDKLAAVKRYDLTAKISDPYHFFCLEEELKQHKIKYYLDHKHNQIHLVVYSRDRQQLTFLIKTLKTYNIEAKLLSHNEEKQWKKVL